MLDQILSLVRDNAQDLIVNNKAVPNQFNDAAINDTASSLFDGLKQEVSAGNLSGLMDLFQQGSSGQSLLSNPIVSNIASKLATQFTSKYGVAQNDAGSISSNLVSGVLGSVVNKINDPNDNSFDLQSLMSAAEGSGLGGLLGGDNKSGGDIGGMLGKLF